MGEIIVIYPLPQPLGSLSWENHEFEVNLDCIGEDTYKSQGLGM